MIRAPGVGSGLDVESIISQLMAIERRPLNALQNKKQDYELQISAYGQLRSALSTFQSAMSGLSSVDKFKVFSAKSGDEATFTATASSVAGAGSYSIEVKNLAAAHKMGSAAFADTATTAIGNAGDQVTIQAGGGSFTVDIGDKTLDQIRDAINNATDNKGVTATIVSETGTSHRLVLTAKETGEANALTLSFSNIDGDPIADPLAMATIAAAEDAEILVDGTYTITRSSNTITDAISGITLNLLKENTAAVSLDVTRDLEAIKESAQGFVDAYNALRATFEDLRLGKLKGESTLRTIESQIRGVLNTAPTGLTGDYNYLSQVGISIQRDGKMTLDGEKLEKALNTDMAGVAELFANNDQGYAFRLDAQVGKILESEGMLDARVDGLDNRITRTKDRIANMEYRLQLIETRYRTQYSMLDAMLGQMRGTSDFLASML